MTLFGKRLWCKTKPLEFISEPIKIVFLYLALINLNFNSTYMKEALFIKSHRLGAIV